MANATLCPAPCHRGLFGSGGHPALAAAAVVVLPQLNGQGVGELLARNYVFKAGFCAWLFAQTAKVNIHVSCVASHCSDSEKRLANGMPASVLQMHCILSCSP